VGCCEAARALFDFRMACIGLSCALFLCIFPSDSRGRSFGALSRYTRRLCRVCLHFLLASGSSVAITCLQLGSSCQEICHRKEWHEVDLSLSSGLGRRHDSCSRRGKRNEETTEIGMFCVGTLGLGRKLDNMHHQFIIERGWKSCS
jgi:hypothetical protein